MHTTAANQKEGINQQGVQEEGWIVGEESGRERKVRGMYVLEKREGGRGRDMYNNRKLE